nr:RNA-directed DNA polymerase [Lentzea xinjiangensis]
MIQADIRKICRVAARKLRSGSYVFTQYREKLVLRGQNKYPRVISVPTARDRIVLRVLAEFIGQVFPAARGVIPQKRVSEVCREVSLARFDSYVRLDVQDFYPSISHPRIRQALSARIKKKDVIDLILGAVSTPTVPDGVKKRPLSRSGVPQGLAISNALAELITAPIDAAMVQRVDCAYFRFVDDVLILCNRAEVDEICEAAISLFATHGLEVHDPHVVGGKSSFGRISKGFDYLGYIFDGRLVSVRPSSIHNVEASLVRKFTRYKKDRNTDDPEGTVPARCEWYVNLTITGCIYKGMARGWLHYFRQMNDYTLLKKLDSTVASFVRRFNVPARIELKSFMRAYWAINKPGPMPSKYIPNFDTMNIEVKRTILIDLFGFSVIGSMTDEGVIAKFEDLVGEAVSELEKDVGSLY